MTDPDFTPDVQKSDSAALRRAYPLIAIFALVSVAENVVTQRADYHRNGLAFDVADVILFELSSSVMLIALVPFVAFCVQRATPGRMPWHRLAAWHFGASIIFSMAHIIGMVTIRKIGFLMMHDGPYIFETSFPGQWIYEYRKDVMTYTLFATILTFALYLGWQSREIARARDDAKTSHRITLKCGGQTVWLQADQVLWAKAAGNYVEVAAGKESHLARATLRELEGQLNAANVPIARVHRSYLVNKEALQSVQPNGDGDLTLTMKDGTSIKGSRRYRGWEAA